ncbi:autotransporter-associated beta strand repeat-containing protein [Pontiella sulfatireligans]|uniref:PEP-CTERM protein-sorting domain-containing protein n=1 Tax=Pontiella sulfatireligans TaxID=2750658 RepID=A0A6C2UHQ8_9BACT|nr:autotransporter-associated beta strand repeat-containing protein [Pontiella sulfatireligans]VGO19745.1 hypothetical protein SCARR_01804 [Pontiella sulfatireligans]
MNKLVCILGISLLAAGVAQAATYTWTGLDAKTRMTNVGNWDAPPVWNNTADLILTSAGKAPGSTYNNITARSITFSNNITVAYGFGINRATTLPRSLTMSADSGNATMTVQSGISADITITATYATPDGVVTNQNPLVLASNLDIVHNGTGLLNLSARITGANDIIKTGSGTLRFSSANNDYTGSTVINDGKLTLLSGGQLLFDIDDDDVNNSLSGSGQATLLGRFRFDLTGASTTDGDSWQIVDVANLNESFEDSFTALSTVGSFAESDGVWSISENGADYEFSESTGFLTVIPEPATLGMVMATAGGILFIRRRFMM